MMPGGGAQYAAMGRELYDEEPVYRAVIDDCADALQRGGRRRPARGRCSPTAIWTRPRERLEAPSVALPALFATEVAMGRLLESWGITPAAMIGHSAGEYAAACLSGVVSMEDGLALVALRGRLFETLPKGAMVSVPLSEDELRDAAARRPEHRRDQRRRPVRGVRAGGARSRSSRRRSPPATSTPPACTSTSPPTRRCWSRSSPSSAPSAGRSRSTPPTIPYVSNLTGTWITAADVTDPDYWVRHLRSTVRFRDGIDTILADTNRVLLEVGPGRTLAGLARMAPAPPAAVSPTLRHPREAASDVAFALAAVGRAWEAGVELDPATLFADEERHRLPLPTYPFDRQRYWVEPDAVRRPPFVGQGRAAQAAARRRLVLHPVLAPLDRHPARRAPGALVRRPHRRRPSAGGRPRRSPRWQPSRRVGGARRSLPAPSRRPLRGQPGAGRRLGGARRGAGRRRRAAGHHRPRHRARAVARSPPPRAGRRRRPRRLPRDDRSRPRQHAVPGARPVGDLGAGAAGARHEWRPRPRLHRSAAARTGAAPWRRAGHPPRARQRRHRGDRHRPPEGRQPGCRAAGRRGRGRAGRRLGHRRRGAASRRALAAHAGTGGAATGRRVAVAAGRRPPHHRRLRRHRHVDRPAHRQELGAPDARARRARRAAARGGVGRGPAGPRHRPAGAPARSTPSCNCARSGPRSSSPPPTSPTRPPSPRSSPTCAPVTAGSRP